MDPAAVTGGTASAGWEACLALHLEARAGRTVLVRKTQRGPLTVQRAFYPEGAPCHLYVLHPPGGVVGGDRLALAVRIAGGAHGLLTAPGAAKFYRSAGALAEQRQDLRVAAGGVLEWLPPETILFPGARLRFASRVCLAGDARFIGWEAHSLGRPVIGERFDHGSADLSLRLERDGRPLLSERLRVAGGAGLAAPSGLRAAPVSGMLLATGADGAAVDAARAALAAGPDSPVGVTLLGDVLVARALAPGVEPLMRRLRALWAVLRPRLLDRMPVPPRIWAT